MRNHASFWNVRFETADGSQPSTYDCSTPSPWPSSPKEPLGINALTSRTDALGNRQIAHPLPPDITRRTRSTTTAW